MAVSITEESEGEKIEAVRLGTQTPSQGIPVIDPAEIVVEISRQVAEEVRSQIATHLGGGGGDNGGGSAPPASKSFLGESMGHWAKWFLKGAVVAGASLFAWYTYVNTALAVRPTHAEAAQMVEEFVKAHEDHGRHPKVEKVVEVLETFREIQSQQAVIQAQQAVLLEAQGKDIESAETKLERHRNRDH